MPVADSAGALGKALARGGARHRAARAAAGCSPARRAGPSRARPSSSRSRPRPLKAGIAAVRGLAARPAPRVRDAPRGPRRRPPGRPAHARPRRHRDDRDLHPRLPLPRAQGLRPDAPEGVADPVMFEEHRKRRFLRRLRGAVCGGLRSSRFFVAASPAAGAPSSSSRTGGTCASRRTPSCPAARTGTATACR